MSKAVAGYIVEKIAMSRLARVRNGTEIPREEVIGFAP